MGVRVQKVHRVQRGRWIAAARLKELCPLGKGCVRSCSGGDSASGAEGCGIALWAMNIYAAKGGSKSLQPRLTVSRLKGPSWYLPDRQQLGEALRNTEKFWGDCQSAAFPPTGIYWLSCHFLFLPRSFASLRMTVGGGKAVSQRRLLPQEGAGRSPEDRSEIFSKTGRPYPPSPTAPPAGRALRCSLYVQAMLT